MREDWFYGGRYYLLTMASNVDRDGMALELEDAAPAPGRGEVAEVFYRDEDGAMTMQSFTQEPLPLALVERLIAEAHRLLPPATGSAADPG